MTTKIRQYSAIIPYAFSVPFFVVAAIAAIAGTVSLGGAAFMASLGARLSR